MFKYLRLLLVCGPRIIWSYFAFLVKYSRHPEKYPLEVRYRKFRALAVFVCRHWHIDFKVQNIEMLNEQKHASLIISNHLSDFDPIALVACSEKPITFVAKKEISHYPFIARCLRSIDGVFIDRNDLRQEVRALQKVQELLSKNYINFAIFPEGTRNKDPLAPVQEFKAGALRSAFKANVPVVEMSLYGTFRPFKKSLHLKKYPVFMSFIKEYSTEDLVKTTTGDLAIKMRDEVQESVDDLRALDEKYMLALSKKTT
ncbi:MAG: lysophospholipid acyltransferase family protein [Bacilli bacterium]|jgi:1-acyl-sn-glycerol-3-phosphate acyltransferase